MHKEPFSVLIPDGESEFALFVVHCLSAYPNVRICVASRHKWAPARFSRFSHALTCQGVTTDDSSRLDILADIVQKNKIDVLLPTSSPWISWVIAHRRVLSTLLAIVPLPEEWAFEIANHKGLLARFLVQNEIPCPPTMLVTDSAIREDRFRELEFPVLLKPVTAWGGEGIQRFEHLDGLMRYLEGLGAESVNDRFVVQSFLNGFVVGVNILSQKGQVLATTMQRGIIPNTQKYAAAGAIQFIHEERFLSIARRLVSALNWSGFANLDTLYDVHDDQLKILEINARFWGSLRGSLLAGVNFPYLACLAALGISFPMPDYEEVRYCHPKTALMEMALRLVGKNRQGAFSFRETGLQFLAIDPLAEGMRACQQEISGR